MKIIKKIYNFIASIFLYSLFFILAIIGICVGLYFIDQYQSVKSGVERPPLFGAFVIVSPSMEPNIKVRDAVITMRKDVEKIKKGDVITFVSKDPSHYGIRITHRIVGVFNNDNNNVSYRTKGDNNNVEDAKLVDYRDVLGKVMLVLPFIGYLQEFISTIYGWMLLIVLPCVYVIGSDIIKLISKSKEENSENDEKNNRKKEKVKKEKGEK